MLLCRFMYKLYGDTFSILLSTYLVVKWWVMIHSLMSHPGLLLNVHISWYFLSFTTFLKEKSHLSFSFHQNKCFFLLVWIYRNNGVNECTHAKSLQSYPTLCNPLDCSPPGSSVHGILQARILEWVAMLSSRGSSQSRDWTHISYNPCIGRWVLYHQHPWEVQWSK